MHIIDYLYISFQTKRTFPPPGRLTAGTNPFGLSLIEPFGNLKSMFENNLTSGFPSTVAVRVPYPVKSSRKDTLEPVLNVACRLETHMPVV
jgi:hypothetical protein